jgi:hypothetical protein
MAEKIKHQKSNNEIKNDLIDLKLRSYQVESGSQDESKLITKSFGSENSLLVGKKIPFFFSEYLCKRKFIHNSTDDMSDYFKTIMHDVRVALDIPEVLQTLEDYIDVLDRPESDNKKLLLPRYKKLKRLESVYDLLVSFILSLIHNFYWKDITLGVEKGVGTKNLTYRIQQILPLVLKIKHDLEDEIEKEYPHDKYEKELFTKFR